MIKMVLVQRFVTWVRIILLYLHLVLIVGLIKCFLLS